MVFLESYAPEDIGHQPKADQGQVMCRMVFNQYLPSYLDPDRYCLGLQQHHHQEPHDAAEASETAEPHLWSMQASSAKAQTCSTHWVPSQTSVSMATVTTRQQWCSRHLQHRHHHRRRVTTLVHC
jgi:hypothetical protein